MGRTSRRKMKMRRNRRCCAHHLRPAAGAAPPAPSAPVSTSSASTSPSSSSSSTATSTSSAASARQTITTQPQRRQSTSAGGSPPAAAAESSPPSIPSGASVSSVSTCGAVITPIQRAQKKKSKKKKKKKASGPNNNNGNSSGNVNPPTPTPSAPPPPPPVPQRTLRPIIAPVRHYHRGQQVGIATMEGNQNEHDASLALASLGNSRGGGNVMMIPVPSGLQGLPPGQVGGPIQLRFENHPSSGHVHSHAGAAGTPMALISGGNFYCPACPGVQIPISLEEIRNASAAGMTYPAPAALLPHPPPVAARRYRTRTPSPPPAPGATRISIGVGTSSPVKAKPVGNNEQQRSGGGRPGRSDASMNTIITHGHHQASSSSAMAAMNPPACSEQKNKTSQASGGGKKNTKKATFAVGGLSTASSQPPDDDGNSSDSSEESDDDQNDHQNGKLQLAQFADIDSNIKRLKQMIDEAAVARGMPVEAWEEEEAEEEKAPEAPASKETSAKKKKAAPAPVAPVQKVAVVKKKKAPPAPAPNRQVPAEGDSDEDSDSSSLPARKYQKVVRPSSSARKDAEDTPAPAQATANNESTTHPLSGILRKSAVFEQLGRAMSTMYSDYVPGSSKWRLESVCSSTKAFFRKDSPAASSSSAAQTASDDNQPSSANAPCGSGKFQQKKGKVITMSEFCKCLEAAESSSETMVAIANKMAADAAKAKEVSKHPTAATEAPRTPIRHLIDIEKANEMVSFLGHFIQFLADYDAAMKYVPATRSGRLFMRKMLVASQLFGPMLDAFRNLWDNRNGGNCRGKNNDVEPQPEDMEHFIKWRKFGLLMRRAEECRRQWEKKVEKKGGIANNSKSLMREFLKVDAAVRDVSILFGGNKACLKMMKDFIMQNPSGEIPEVFEGPDASADEDSDDDDDDKEKGHGGIGGRQLSHSLEDVRYAPQKNKMESEYVEPGMGLGTCYSDPGGEIYPADDESVWPWSDYEELSEKGGDSDSDDCVYDKIFDHFGFGFRNEDMIDEPKLLAAVVDLMNKLIETHGPKKIDDFIKFNSKSCRLIMEHVLYKAGKDV